MRETYRSEDNKTYWTKRWDSIETDEMMENKEKYPLKYTLDAISYQNKDQKILEAGCGAGRILSYLHNNDYSVVGIEFIENAVKKIKLKNPNLEVYTMDITKTSFNNEEFDTILAFGLYHNFQLDDLKKSLIETKRILKHSGILCFSFRADNIQNLILDTIKGKKSSKSKFHKLNLKRNEIEKILNDEGLRIIKSHYVVNMPLLFHFKIFRSQTKKILMNMLEEKKVIH